MGLTKFIAIHNTNLSVDKNIPLYTLFNPSKLFPWPLLELHLLPLEQAGCIPLARH